MDRERYGWQDRETSVDIAVGFGCNLCSWIVGGRELLYAAPDFGEDASGFYEGGGTPLLFPSVGRTWDRSTTPAVPERYRVAGREGEFTLPNHGIGTMGTWRRLRADRAADEIVIEYAFHYDAEVRLRHYPFDVEFRQVFILRPDSVELAGTARNLGADPAPVAYGYHPYFRIASDELLVRLPCGEQVELDPELLVPTGATSPFSGELTAAVASCCDIAFGGMTGRRASLIDRQGACAVHLDVDENIANFVIYSGEGQPFVCVEPWTAGLGAYESLSDPGWPEAGRVPVLAPGASRTVRTVFAFETGC